VENEIFKMIDRNKPSRNKPSVDLRAFCETATKKQLEEMLKAVRKQIADFSRGHSYCPTELAHVADEHLLMGLLTLKRPGPSRYDQVRIRDGRLVTLGFGLLNNLVKCVREAEQNEV